MAKYCAKCGKALPEGVEVCPDCHAAAQEDGAAPFTRITAETEVWAGDAVAKPKKERPKRTRTQKQVILLAAAAAVVLALTVFLIVYIQPVNRVTRYIRSENYDRAMELYWGTESLASGAHGAEIDRAVLRKAEEIRDRYAAHEIGADEAATALSKLGTFGEGAQALLADVYDEFRALGVSQEHFANAEKLEKNGSYLEARAEYLLVSAEDLSYAEAQEKAEASVESYVDSVMTEASLAIQTGDYAAAIETLEAGERALLDHELFSEKLDFKRQATYSLFETDLLEAAGALAELEDYASAAELLRQNMERFGYETEALTRAMDGYLSLAADKALADAVERAGRLYTQGSEAEAFALLDAQAESEAANAAVEALEARFASDRIAEAEEAFGNDREELPKAVALLEDALKLRDVEAIRDYLDEISRYLPVSLAELEYASKEGTLLRYASTGSTAFEALDGVTYGDGWVWGADGASVTFLLDGGYDLLEGIFAVREGRDERARAGGHFEVWCDGEQVYASETLLHTDTEPLEISVDISGCDELTIRFFNDYAVSTAEGGYCYHGLCSPTITKDMPA